MATWYPRATRDCHWARVTARSTAAALCVDAEDVVAAAGEMREDRVGRTGQPDQKSRLIGRGRTSRDDEDRHRQAEQNCESSSLHRVGAAIRITTHATWKGAVDRPFRAKQPDSPVRASPDCDRCGKTATAAGSEAEVDCAVRAAHVGRRLREYAHPRVASLERHPCPPSTVTPPPMALRKCVVLSLSRKPASITWLVMSESSIANVKRKSGDTRAKPALAPTNGRARPRTPRIVPRPSRRTPGWSPESTSRTKPGTPTESRSLFAPKLLPSGHPPTRRPGTV